MTLLDARKGDTVRVVSVPPGVVGAQMLRLGISEGCEVTCVLRIFSGPMVVRQGTMELALGRSIASRIEVDKRDA